LAVSNPLQIRKVFRRSRNVINTACRPCSPSLYLKVTQISVLPSKSEERVHKKNDALDNTERTFGQAGITERRLVYQFLKVVDVERARGDEQGASNEREEEIHAAVHWRCHHTADKQADQNNQVSPKGAHGYHRGMLISRIEGVVVQSDKDAYQDKLKEFYDRQSRDGRHFV